MLVVGYALTVGTVGLCAAIGVHSACRAPDLRSAVLRAYGRVAVLVCGAFVPPLVFASPFATRTSSLTARECGLLHIVHSLYDY